jgi:hypothetical protein
MTFLLHFRIRGYSSEMMWMSIQIHMVQVYIFIGINFHEFHS